MPSAEEMESPSDLPDGTVNRSVADAAAAADGDVNAAAAVVVVVVDDAA